MGRVREEKEGKEDEEGGGMRGDGVNTNMQGGKKVFI